MIFPYRLSLVLPAAVMLAAGGLVRGESSSGVVVSRSRPLAPATTAEPVLDAPVQTGPVVADGWQRRQEFKAEVAGLLKDRKFGELDAMAERLNKGEREVGGFWLLPSFFEGIASALDRQKPVEYGALLEEWRAQNPASQAALIAEAEWQIKLGWEARYKGWGRSAPPEYARKFCEHIAWAKLLLNSIPSRQVVCPQWYYDQLSVALAEQWDEWDYDTVYEEATRRWPSYATFYSQKSYYLMPGCHGQPGDWERYARSAAEASPEGAALYTRIVRSKLEYYGNIFSETKVDWPLTREGCEQLMARYPTSGWNIAYACRLAYDARDFATLAKWAPKLDGVAVPNGPLTPGMIRYAQEMAAKPKAATPECIYRKTPDGSECKAVIFLSEDLVAVGTANGGVFLLDSRGETQPRRILALDGAISKFALSPDGRLLAVGRGSLTDGKPGHCVVYDLKEQKRIDDLTGWKGTVTESAFSADSQTLFVVGGPLRKGAEWKAWDRASHAVRDLDWAADRGTTLISVSTHPTEPLVAVDWGETVRVWNYQTGQRVFASKQVIEPGDPGPGLTWTGQVWSVRFSPDGRQLTAGTCPAYLNRGSASGGLFAWDTATFQPRSIGADDHASGADRVRFSPDGGQLVNSDQNAMIFLRDAAGRQIRTIFPSGQKYVKDLALSPSGRLLATAGLDGTVALWRLP
ncbi:hypothetical protein BH09VER1_BH09VER1_49330 [soil metagenome]